MANDAGNEVNPEKLEIKVAAHVVVQLGRELVSDEEQALLELVKNAYDANSPDCEIILEPDWEPPINDSRLEFLDFPIDKVNPQQLLPGLEEAIKKENKKFPPLKGRIRVVDTGDGANPIDVHQSWLTVSFSNKRPDSNHPKVKQEGARVPVGDKGLGRLATMKLGRVLTFRTAIPDSTDETVTSFSWDDFSKVSSVDKVRVRETTEPRSIENRGSTVEILGLHDADKWKSQESLTRLIGRLSNLINPFNSIPDFAVVVRHKGKPHDLQDVIKNALPFAPAKFEFEWDGENLTCTSTIQRGLFRGNNEETKISFDKVFSKKEDTTSFIAWVKDHKKFSKKIPITNSSSDPSKDLFTFCHVEDLKKFPLFKKFPGAKNPGKFSAKFYYFLFNNTEITKLKTISSSSEQIQAMSGISIYRDGFKVRMTEDWIGLAEGTTSGGFYFLRPKNTLGFFELSNEFNPELTEKSDREGFVDSEAYRGLMALALQCRDWSNTVLSNSRDAFTEYNRLMKSPNTIPTVKGTVEKIKDTSSKLNSELNSARNNMSFTTEKLDKVALQLDQLNENDDPTIRASKKVISEALLAAKGSFNDFSIHWDSIQNKAKVLTDASEEFDSFHSEEKAKHLRLLEAASVGLSARILVHELNTYIDRIEDASRNIVRITKTAENPEIRYLSTDLSSATRELRKLVATIDPLLPGTRSLKENFSATNTIKEFLSSQASLANNFQIDFVFSGMVENPCLIRFNRTRFYQIIENLLQNSIYWIQRSGNPSSRGKISVTFNSSGFNWSDSGGGIKQTIEESLFEAFETSKPSGEGQGLGLHIVKTFLEAENCSITLSQERNTLGLRYIFSVNLTGALQNN